MNRYFRRLQTFGKSLSGRERQPHPHPTDQSEELARDSTVQEVASVRAKNEGHRKKTADKWNQ